MSIAQTQRTAPQGGAHAAARDAGSHGAICAVWDAEYPWDVRVEKVTRALTTGGYDVHLVARNRGRTAAVEVLPEATVQRLTTLSWAPDWLNTASMFPAFFNPRWVRAIHRVARQSDARLILCRDLPLAIPSILVARRLGIPMLLDMAENYPAMLQARHASGQTGVIDLVVRSPRFAQWVENWVLPRVDGVLVVVEESRDRLVRQGVPAERITIVSNTPPLDRLQAPRAAPPADGALRLAYIGLLELQRGIATILDAVAELRRTGIHVTLSLLGGGRDEGALRQIAARNGITDAVSFSGWLPNDAALRGLRDAHLGLIPHWKDESWNTTIPNKLFDYMAAGLPVITSDAGPAARIVSQTGSGVVYADRDPMGLAAAVRSLSNGVAWSRAADAGREAIMRQYHWEADASRMLRAVADMTIPK